jgi:signal transduction histidine kinase
MFDSAANDETNEMQVVDLRGDAEFMGRRIRPRDVGSEVVGLQRLARVFAQRPDRILQELVEVSVDVCDAHSAGITLEETLQDGETQFRWIAIAGKYGGFVGAVLPRAFSPCGTCLDRGGPQLFRVSKAYLDMIGVQAPPVTDGLLIPWQVDKTRGTIWVIAHGPFQCFDREDYRLLQSLSDFAAIAVRHQHQQEALMRQAAATAAAEMANSLAHQINNPLQGLMQTVFLASQDGANADVFANQAMEELKRLTELVRQLLELPKILASVSQISLHN